MRSQIPEKADARTKARFQFLELRSSLVVDLDAARDEAQLIDGRDAVDRW